MGSQGKSAAAPAALADLIRTYMPALRAHLVGAMRLNPHQADDALQGFLTDRVLERNTLALANEQRGRFRNFLLTALERFVIDEHRRASARKRSPSTSVVDVHEHESAIPSPPAPPDLFERAWAGEVLREVLRRTRQECIASGRSHLWEVFEARILLPVTDGLPVPSHEALCQRLKLGSPVQAANALGSAKRVFRRNFRSVVAEYAADESEIDEEIRELWAIFSSPRA